MSQEDQRAAILAEARSWLGTPFHHRARIKGSGVDCAQLVIAVYAAVGLIEDFQPEDYPPDWHLHRSDERFLQYVVDRARQVEAPEPGDLILMQFGRCYSHGAILVDAHTCIHAFVNRGVELGDLAEWRKRPKAYFSVVH